MRTQATQSDVELERRCRALMDALEPVVTPDQQQQLDMYRFLVTHLKDYGLWLDEIRQILEEQQIVVPMPIYQEIVRMGLTMEVEPDHWSRIIVSEEPARQHS